MSPPRRLVAAVAAVLLAPALLSVMPARADRASSLAAALAAKRARAHALQSAIAADRSQIDRYQQSLTGIESRLAAIQGDLQRNRALLAATQAQERVEHERLARLELQLQHADQALARNLVSTYESDQPDALTVILNARGFSDLIERVDFLKRVKQQNAEVITSDRQARIQVIAEANRLGALEVRQQRLTSAILGQRGQVDSLRIGVVQRQLVVIRARDRTAGALAANAAERSRLQQSLASLRASQARVQARAVTRSPAVAPGNGPTSSAPALSSGGFTFPLPAGAASPSGSWSQDQGVDISAAGDTPELAVASGTIVLHGIGGFGAWAPVLHLDSPIDGQSYVYYGHAGPQGELPVGTHVGAGQVLGSIGPGIVGLSTGPHLEIGFADASGTPAPGTSGTMLSLLQSSFHG
jgi:murein DD-endopeptidase MepM/ murein hydrolase activator NlpD